MLVNPCRIRDNDAGLFSDSSDVLQVLAGPCCSLGVGRAIDSFTTLGKVGRNFRAIHMGQIAFCLAHGIVQIDLGARLQRQTLGDLVGELVELRVVLVEVLGDGAVEVVRHVLADLGIGGIVLFAISIAHDFLLNGRDARFLVDVNGRASHDSEDGRRARLAVSDGAGIGHKEPVTVL